MRALLYWKKENSKKEAGRRYSERANSRQDLHVYFKRDLNEVDRHIGEDSLIRIRTNCLLDGPGLAVIASVTNREQTTLCKQCSTSTNKVILTVKHLLGYCQAFKDEW